MPLKILFLSDRHDIRNGGIKLIVTSSMLEREFSDDINCVHS